MREGSHAVVYHAIAHSLMFYQRHFVKMSLPVRVILCARAWALFALSLNFAAQQRALSSQSTITCAASRKIFGGPGESSAPARARSSPRAGALPGARGG